jgi:hypothetical protein
MDQGVGGVADGTPDLGKGGVVGGAVYPGMGGVVGGALGVGTGGVVAVGGALCLGVTGEVVGEALTQFQLLLPSLLSAFRELWRLLGTSPVDSLILGRLFTAAPKAFVEAFKELCRELETSKADSSFLVYLSSVMFFLEVVGEVGRLLAPPMLSSADWERCAPDFVGWREFLGDVFSSAE